MIIAGANSVKMIRIRPNSGYYRFAFSRPQAKRESTNALHKRIRESRIVIVRIRMSSPVKSLVCKDPELNLVIEL